MTKKKYYVNVELRDYDDKEIAYSSCNLDVDISNQAITDAVRVAGELMIKHHTGVRIEQEKQKEAS